MPAIRSPCCSEPSRRQLKDAETIDLRLAKSLDAKIPLSFERGVSIASPDSPLDLKSLGSAQLQVYASVRALLKLYKTLVNDPRLGDFDELGIWHTLDRDAKLDAYSRLASHELHLFLSFHDPSFFNEVIKPYLENKKEKQFIDHWLLGDDLSPYTQLWRYNQLNAAERTLLAMRLPDARETVRRELREIVASQDENHAAVRKSIESALMNCGMQLGEDAEGEQILEERLSELRHGRSGCNFLHGHVFAQMRAKKAQLRRREADSRRQRSCHGVRCSAGGSPAED